MKDYSMMFKIISASLQVLGAIVALWCGMLVLMVYNRKFFFGLFGDFVVVNEEPELVDVIIVLSGFGMAKRVSHGVRVYKSGYAGRMLMVGGPSCRRMVSCPERMKEQAVSLGIPSDSIFLEEHSTTTYKNAQYSLKWMQVNRCKSCIVVTSPFHTKRTKIVFDRLFRNSNISLTINAATDEKSYPANWWQGDVNIQRVTIEYMKLIWYYLFQVRYKPSGLKKQWVQSLLEKRYLEKTK